MFHVQDRSSSGRSWLAWIMVGAVLPAVGLLGGCQGVAGLPDSGIALALPDAWEPADLTTYTVPGEPLAAWTGPDGSSLVVFRSLRVPGGTAARLVVGEATRFDASPGMADIAHSVVTLPGGVEAARVELVGPGSGDMLAPPVTGVALPMDAGSNLVPTRRISLAVPREDDTVWLYVHFPETARDRLMPPIEEILDGLQVRDARRVGS